jgi:predicted anti-sigma-YlaC factor YlaD
MPRSVFGLVEPGQQVQHLSAEFLGLHVLGDLPILQRWQVEDHLSMCGACRDQLRHVARVIAAFEKEPARSAPRRHSSLSPWSRPGTEA